MFRNTFITFAVGSSMLLLSCFENPLNSLTKENSSNKSPTTANIQSILMITQGYPKVDLTSSSILITQDSIFFKKDSLLITAIKDSKDNIIMYRYGSKDSLVMSWTKPIINSDFESVALLVIKNQIIGMPDPVRNPGPVGKPKSILIQLDGQIDTVNVYPGAQTPEQLEEVFAEINSVAVKYGQM